MHRPNKSSQ